MFFYFLGNQKFKVSVFVLIIFAGSALAYSTDWDSVFQEALQQYEQEQQQCFIEDFRPNGCTWSPDGFSWMDVDWEWACNQHDEDYLNIWMTKEEADLRLFQNMLDADAPELVAGFYYRIVSDWGDSWWEEAQQQSREAYGY
jgi:hypothetical protein